MSRLEALLSAGQFADVAALLEGLDGPLAEQVRRNRPLMTLPTADPTVSLTVPIVQPESVELWLYLILGHLYNHRWCGSGCSAVRLDWSLSSLDMPSSDPNPPRCKP